MTKDDFLQTIISQNDVITNNVFGADHNTGDIGYNLFVFDIRDQSKFSSPHLIKENFNFQGKLPADIVAYAPLSTKNLITISSDGQRHFDLIQTRITNLKTKKNTCL